MDSFTILPDKARIHMGLSLYLFVKQQARYLVLKRTGLDDL